MQLLCSFEYGLLVKRNGLPDETIFNWK